MQTFQSFPLTGTQPRQNRKCDLDSQLHTTTIQDESIISLENLHGNVEGVNTGVEQVLRISFPRLCNRTRIWQCQSSRHRISLLPRNLVEGRSSLTSKTTQRNNKPAQTMFHGCPTWVPMSESLCSSKKQIQRVGNSSTNRKIALELGSSQAELRFQSRGDERNLVAGCIPQEPTKALRTKFVIKDTFPGIRSLSSHVLLL
mmetsp:Transcript_64411/g.172396  ORF Transcript_64411/g.172396 Transcript_64411/m.172396 type:complete len:201 (-) Transcript_64411:2604-3206(-)